MACADNMPSSVADLSASLLLHFYYGFRLPAGWIFHYVHSLLRLDNFLASFAGQRYLRRPIDTDSAPPISTSRMDNNGIFVWCLQNSRLCLGFRLDQYTSRFSFYMDAACRHHIPPLYGDISQDCQRLMPLFSVLCWPERRTFWTYANSISSNPQHRSKHLETPRQPRAVLAKASALGLPPIDSQNQRVPAIPDRKAKQPGHGPLTVLETRIRMMRCRPTMVRQIPIRSAAPKAIHNSTTTKSDQLPPRRYYQDSETAL